MKKIYIIGLRYLVGPQCDIQGLVTEFRKIAIKPNSEEEFVQWLKEQQGFEEMDIEQVWIRGLTV